MGKVHIVVDREFGSLEKAFEKLPYTFDSQGTILYEGRNTVRLIDFEGVQLVVKRFRRLQGVKKLIYKYRKTKALRAYTHAHRLNELGVRTPSPAAYAVVYSAAGMPVDSYYVSRYEPLPPLESFFGGEGGFNRQVIEAFSGFVVGLQEKGILFDDLNCTNVLVKIEPDSRVAFSLIDINRIRFKNPADTSLSELLVNISRFCYDRPDIFEFFVNSYAKKTAPWLSLDLDVLKAKALEMKKKEDASRRRLSRLKHPIRYWKSR